MVRKLKHWMVLAPRSMLVRSTSTELEAIEKDLGRVLGREAQRTNIELACSISDRLRETLGPAGLDKMLVSYFGRDEDAFNFEITGDGMRILERTFAYALRPVSRLVVNAARTLENEMGDGTTTVVVLTGELLKQALRLLKSGIHRNTIVRGYELAAKKSVDVFKDMAINIHGDDQDLLRKVALTALSGSPTEPRNKHLADLALQATRVVTEKGKTVFKKDRIKIEKIKGGANEEAELVLGVLLHRARANPSMPKRVENAKIAIVTSRHIRAKDTKFYAGDFTRDVPLPVTFKVKDPKQIDELLRAEERIVKEMAGKIRMARANVLIAEKGIDAKVDDRLTRDGILALAGVDKYDIERLAEATGATPVADVNELSSTHLGFAGAVEEVDEAGEVITYVKECRRPKCVTIVVRGGTRSQVAGAIQDCVGAIGATLSDCSVLPGGGASEMEASIKLRDYMQTIGKKERLAVEAFADALEGIPAALAENSGMDSVDTLIRLRAIHGTMRRHRSRDATRMGIDAINGTVKDAVAAGILDPLEVKRRVVCTAQEAASMILSIDDVIMETLVSSLAPHGPKHPKPEQPRT